MLTINEVENRVYELGNILNIDKESRLYPMFSNTPEVFSEGVSIYVTDTKYHYIIMERGRERKHYESSDLDDILYYIFKSITFSLASDYEVKHRRENQDFRRLLFSKQLELIRKISEQYYQKCNHQIKEILKISPFRD